MSPEVDVFTALAACTCEPRFTGVKVRGALASHLAAAGLSLERSTGIHGLSVRADIFFGHRGEDFHITARAPVSEEAKSSCSSARCWS